VTRHFDQRILSYVPDKLFSLVADIERYPEFLPWRQKAVVYERKGNTLKAGLTVGAKGFQDTFTSFVTLEEASRIGVVCAGGALSRLTNEWTFASHGANECDVSFFVDFEFRSKILSAMMTLFFNNAFRKMSAAFEGRARVLYG
jgi:coenzyme Q-binding protein COQ10